MALEGVVFFFWLGQSKGLSSAAGSRGRRFERAKTCPGSCNNTTSDRPTLGRAFLESIPRLRVSENSGRALGAGQHCCTQEVWHRTSSLGRTPATSRSHSQILFVLLQRSVESSSFQTMAAGSKSTPSAAAAAPGHVSVGLFRGFRWKSRAATNEASLSLQLAGSSNTNQAHGLLGIPGCRLC